MSETLPVVDPTVVKFDVSDLVDRLFVCPELDRSLGVSKLLQDGLKLSILDKRRFTPPIESKEDREANLEAVCRTFCVSSDAIGRLKARGFRSTTLLSMLPVGDVQKFEFDPPERKRLAYCIRTLNRTPLEPLYSLSRLAACDWTSDLRGRAACQALDLADFDGYCHRQVLAKRNRQRKQAVSSTSKAFVSSTFGASNRFTLGRQIASLGLEHHKPQPARAESRPQPPLLFFPANTFLLGYPMRFAVFFPRCGSPTDSIHSDSLKNPVVLNKKWKAEQQWFCPYLSCHESFASLDDHLRERHKFVIGKRARHFVREAAWYRSAHAKVGHVKLEVEVELLCPSYVWWGPKVFLCDGITFFVALFKPHCFYAEDLLVFLVCAHVDGETASNYSSDVEICSVRPYGRSTSKLFRGKVFPLAQAVDTGCWHSVQRMVYFRHREMASNVFPDGKIRFNVGLYKHN